MSLEIVNPNEAAQLSNSTTTGQAIAPQAAGQFANLMGSSYQAYNSATGASGVLETAAAQALETAKMNAGLSAITQQASVTAAALKIQNDMNDASVNFTKNIGSSVKSAAS
jgi:hypothetical protein